MVILLAALARGLLFVWDKIVLLCQEKAKWQL